MKTQSSHAQQLWHETHGWLLDLEGNSINPETYVFNPICKNRLKVRKVFSENMNDQSSADVWVPRRGPPRLVGHELQAPPENYKSAQACVTAVLTTHNDTGDDSVLDNILNCPCMERCFNGAPCRTKGDYIDFAKAGFYSILIDRRSKPIKA